MSAPKIDTFCEFQPFIILSQGSIVALFIYKLL